MSEFKLEIGQASGDVYRYLHDHGQVSVTQLRKELPLGRGRVDQALGWLAREDKIEFIQDKRTTFVSLLHVTV
jgi:hypothetical protein